MYFLIRVVIKTQNPEVKRCKQQHSSANGWQNQCMRSLARLDRCNMYVLEKDASTHIFIPRMLVAVVWCDVASRYVASYGINHFSRVSCFTMRVNP